MPIISETIGNLLKVFARCRDRGICTSSKDVYSTKQTQIYSYIDLYVGSEYIIHFK